MKNAFIHYSKHLISIKRGSVKMARLIKDTDNKKLLDQMFEDLAGEEFEDYDEVENTINQDFYDMTEHDDFVNIDQLH